MLAIKSRQQGETIIEVMVCLAVLGLVLGLSFASARRSLRSSQDAQERTVASQLAQSLIEVTKFQATRTPTGAPGAALLFPAPGASGQFCISTEVSDDEEADMVPVAPSPAACDRGIYQARVEVNALLGTTLPTYEYTARVQWESGVSGTTNQALMRYKWVR